MWVVGVAVSVGRWRDALMWGVGVGCLCDRWRGRESFSSAIVSPQYNKLVDTMHLKGRAAVMGSPSWPSAH